MSERSAKKKSSAVRICVFEERPDRAESRPVAAFYTHYRALKFVRKLSSKAERELKDVKWVIRTSRS